MVMTCQKAPSAKRCIKTHHGNNALLAHIQLVRKHRAPKGALRLSHYCQAKIPALMPSENTERQKVH